MPRTEKEYRKNAKHIVWCGAVPHQNDSVTDIPERCLEELAREGIRISEFADARDRCKPGYKKGCPTSYRVDLIDAHVLQALGYEVHFSEE